LDAVAVPVPGIKAPAADIAPLKRPLFPTTTGESAPVNTNSARRETSIQVRVPLVVIGRPLRPVPLPYAVTVPPRPATNSSA